MLGGMGEVCPEMLQLVAVELLHHFEDAPEWGDMMRDQRCRHVVSHAIRIRKRKRDSGLVRRILTGKIGVLEMRINTCNTSSYLGKRSGMRTKCLDASLRSLPIWSADQSRHYMLRIGRSSTHYGGPYRAADQAGPGRVISPAPMRTQRHCVSQWPRTRMGRGE